jgi:hypothetical protein
MFEHEVIAVSDDLLRWFILLDEIPNNKTVVFWVRDPNNTLMKHRLHYDRILGSPCKVCGYPAYANQESQLDTEHACIAAADVFTSQKTA